MKTPFEMADEAASRLQGTGQSIANLGDEFEALELNNEFCTRLDDLVFCCNICDNWYEQSEMSENQDWVCEGCSK